MTMSIVFAGTPDNAASTLLELAKSGLEIALVITRPDAPIGRKRVITASPVAVVAETLGLPVIKTAAIGTFEIDAIKASGAQMGIVVAFGSILREAALSALELGWFNLHYSLLPAWRGAAPVQHALLAGLEVTGVTLFKLDTGMDTGPVVNQVAVPIEISDNTGTLLKRLTNIGTSLLLQEIPRIFAGVVSLHPQTETGVSLAPKPSRLDARVSHSDSARSALAKVRAFNPEPGAWLMWQNQPFKLLDAAVAGASDIANFRVELIGDAVLLGTANGVLRLIEVQPAGKGAMRAIDWFRGTSSSTRTFE